MPCRPRIDVDPRRRARREWNSTSSDQSESSVARSRRFDGVHAPVATISTFSSDIAHAVSRDVGEGATRELARSGNRRLTERAPKEPGLMPGLLRQPGGFEGFGSVGEPFSDGVSCRCGTCIRTQ